MSSKRFDCSQDNEFAQSPYWFLLFDSSFPGYDGYAEQAQVHKLLYRVGYGWVGGFQIITSCSRQYISVMSQDIEDLGTRKSRKTYVPAETAHTNQAMNAMMLCGAGTSAQTPGSVASVQSV